MMDTYRCQWCGHVAPIVEWGKDGQTCPKCKRKYDSLDAQDLEDSP